MVAAPDEASGTQAQGAVVREDGGCGDGWVLSETGGNRMGEYMKKTVTISFKTVKETKDKLVKLSKNGFRSMSQELEMLIETFYEAVFDGEISTLQSFLEEKVRLDRKRSDALRLKSQQDQSSSKAGP